MALTVGVPIAAVTDGSAYGMIVQKQCAFAEMDCADSDTPTVVLIPAAWNKNGLIITRIFGVVTEAMVGSSEDQGVVTVSDESDNSLATLTPSDAAADAIGDIVQGSGNSTEDATGTALTTVAAGEYVDCVVTQNTAGTPAGKILVGIEFYAVPSKA